MNTTIVAVCGIDPPPCNTIIYGDDNVWTEVVTTPTVSPLPVTGTTSATITATASMSLTLGIALVLASLRRRHAIA